MDSLKDLETPSFSDSRRLFFLSPIEVFKELFLPPERGILLTALIFGSSSEYRLGVLREIFWRPDRRTSAY